jgi:hypothetical protein
MVRENVRDIRSSKRVKPRIMDYIRTDDGVEYLEIKDGHQCKTILLKDVEEQIKRFRSNT